MPATPEEWPLVTGSGGLGWPGGLSRQKAPNYGQDDLGSQEDWEELGRYTGPPPAQNEAREQARLTAWVRGRVQGVGFRWWVRRNALELGLLGVAENLVDGRVKIVAEGVRERLVELLSRLEGPETPGQVVQVTHRWDPVRGGFTGFVER